MRKPRDEEILFIVQKNGEIMRGCVVAIPSVKRI